MKYQTQIVTELPNGTTKVAQNDSEQPILPNFQLFQSFPTKVAQNDFERPILPDLQLFQSFPTKVTQNDSGWPNLPDSQLFQSFPTKMINSRGRGNYQMQIVTKLPNEISKTTNYKCLIGGWGGKLPNANCDQTTK